MEDAPPQANGHARVGSGTVAESPQPVVICGPSGVGKGTLIGKLMKEFPDRFGFSVSHTTRNPREKEQDGVHYHFTKRPVMEEEIEEGKFLESAEVHGNLYGTSWAAVNAVSEAGKVRFPLCSGRLYVSCTWMWYLVDQSVWTDATEFQVALELRVSGVFLGNVLQFTNFQSFLLVSCKVHEEHGRFLVALDHEFFSLLPCTFVMKHWLKGLDICLVGSSTF